MVYRLPPLTALRAFEAAARHLSFKRAAEELTVTPTAISHQVRGLEDFLGVALFRRLPRALALTAAGEAMLPKVSEGLDCFAAAVERVRAGLAPEGGRLDVVAPPSFASRWLIPRLHRFYAAWPGIELHLASALRAIDGAGGAGGAGDESMRGGRPQLWIRFGAGRYPGFRTELLFQPSYTPVCSPRLLRAKLPLREPGDLRFHHLIHDDTVGEGHRRATWADWLRAAGVDNGEAIPGLHFSDPALAIAAAIDGLGVALVPKPMVTAELADGRLSAPFEQGLVASAAYYLVMPAALADSPAVAVFRDWLLAEVAADGAGGVATR